MAIIEVQAILNDELEITPELSQKLAGYFGVSDMFFMTFRKIYKDGQAFGSCSTHEFYASAKRRAF